jgi:hypothetical protein
VQEAKKARHQKCTLRGGVREKAADEGILILVDELMGLMRLSGGNYSIV